MDQPSAPGVSSPPECRTSGVISRLSRHEDARGPDHISMAHVRFQHVSRRRSSSSGKSARNAVVAVAQPDFDVLRTRRVRIAQHADRYEARRRCGVRASVSACPVAPAAASSNELTAARTAADKTRSGCIRCAATPASAPATCVSPRRPILHHGFPLGPRRLYSFHSFREEVIRGAFTKSSVLMLIPNATRRFIPYTKKL